MARLRWLLPLCALLGCARELDVPQAPAANAAPQFLGRFSGVYGGLNDPGSSGSRSIVVQLGDRVLFTPIDLRDGVPVLSVFGMILPLSGGDAPSQGFVADFDLMLPTSDWWGAGAVCTDDDAPTSTQEVFAQLAACQSGACTPNCLAPDLYDFAESIPGSCVDGDLCEYHLQLGGALGRDALDLYFPKAAIYPTTRHPVACPDGFERCVRFERICEFDSRVAGVFHAQAVYDPSRSTGPAPANRERAFDVAVGVANELPAVVLFTLDLGLSLDAPAPAGGAGRVFFGPLDPFTLELRADDGVERDSPIRRFRDPGLVTTIDAALLEDEAVGLLLLAGSLVEEGTDGSRRVWALSATRNSGSAPGQRCSPMGGCEPLPLDCPGGSEEPQGQQLHLEQAIGADGCLQTSCSRTVEREALCAPVPRCGGPLVQLPWAELQLERLQLSQRCPDDEPDCTVDRHCLELRCPGPDDLLPPTDTMIDPGCADSPDPLLLSVEAGSGRTLYVGCGRERRVCEEHPLTCPLGQSDQLESEVRSYLDSDGCAQSYCTQRYGPGSVCAGAAVPACGAPELPVPHLRRTAGAPDCVEYLCSPPCDLALCGGCEPCADPVLPFCPDGVIRVFNGCGGCLQLACGTP